MGSWQALPEWAEELAGHFQEGESALFILHGQVFDYTLVNGDYLPFRHFLRHWLAQSRQVVFYNSARGLRLRTPRGKTASQALEPPAQGLAPGEEDGEDISRVRGPGLVGAGPKARG